MNKNKKKKRKQKERIAKIIKYLYILLGLYIVITSITDGHGSRKYPSNSVKTTAEIIRIYERKSFSLNSGFISYWGYVSFFVDGVEYSGATDIPIDRDKQVGDTIYIRYSPKSPSRFKIIDDRSVSPAQMVLFVIFLCLGFFIRPHK